MRRGDYRVTTRCEPPRVLGGWLLGTGGVRRRRLRGLRRLHGGRSPGGWSGGGYILGGFGRDVLRTGDSDQAEQRTEGTNDWMHCISLPMIAASLHRLHAKWGSVGRMCLSPTPPRGARLVRLVALSLLGIACTAVTPACRGQNKAEPQPGLDVVVFTNGDQLTGKLEKGEGDSITFNSDVVGEVTIPLEKIKELRANGSFAVPGTRTAM
jgi:hypothetical protein